MAGRNKGSMSWWELVQSLRQDQQLVTSSWREVQKLSQELNRACDGVFRSVWINHLLGVALVQVLTHRVHPSQWVAALDNAFAVTFVDGGQALEYKLQKAYSQFLDSLRSQPAITSELLLWADGEGLGTQDLISDLMLVMYGRCLFQEDHENFLQLILCLFSNHIQQCHTYKDLFVFEHEFSRAVAEYCRCLPGLTEFLVAALQSPLTDIVNYDKRYLEFDISKASTRLRQGDFHLETHVEGSCDDLAAFCMAIVKNLESLKERFPSSLRWLLTQLKGLIKGKWPGISISELRRPISDVFFRYIISSAFTNPDLLGILDPSIVVNEMSYYNVSQVLGVIQGCAWIMNRPNPSSEYPMKRVVKLMKMKRFLSLIDWLHTMPEGYTKQSPVQSLLPGLRRSFFMASREQLEDLVCVTHEASSYFEMLPDPNPAQRELNRLVAMVPNSVISGPRNPYSFSVKKSSSSNLLDVSFSPESRPKSKGKQRSRSMWGARSEKNAQAIKDLSKSSTLTTNGSLPKSNSAVDTTLRLPTSPVKERFFMPREVMLLPLSQADRHARKQQQQQSDVWEFELLSEEEFLRPRNQPSLSKSLVSPMPSLNPPPTSSLTTSHTTEPPSTDVGSTSKPQAIVPPGEGGSQDSFRCPITNGENSSIRSWSPETYNGSVSADEDEAEYKLVRSSLSKSCEHTTATMQDDMLNPPLSSSLPDTPKGRRKSLKAWLSHKIKKKQRPGTDGNQPDREVQRIGSYTRRVGHITEKYERISKEKKMKEASESAAKSQQLQPPTSDSPLCTRIPSGVEEFKSLPLYSQMKYKLSTILSNIHIPKPPFVSSSPNNHCVKSDLVMLLEECLYRNLWIADSSEYGVIKEVLNTIIELDEECVRSLYLGVVQDQLLRQEYLHYLTNSRQLFVDINLQLGSVQQLVERSRYLEETSFLNFAVQLFLSNSSGKLKEMDAKLQACETADENCSIVETCIQEFSSLLDKDSTWNVWPEEDLSRVNECLDNHLFAHVYQQTFRPNGESDVQRDQVFSHLLTELSSSVTPNHPLIKIPKVYLSSCPWPEVQRELLQMTSYKSPRGKLKCIIKACQLLIRSLQLSKCGDPPGADDTFPALVYVLIKSNPPHLLSTEQYIKTFCESSISGEDAYWWTQFQSAIGFLRTPAFTHQ